jgi:hypothetical protein
MGLRHAQPAPQQVACDHDRPLKIHIASGQMGWGYSNGRQCGNHTQILTGFGTVQLQLRVDLRLLAGSVIAAWFHPRDGRQHPIGKYPREVTTFTSLLGGPDWVLILEAA